MMMISLELYLFMIKLCILEVLTINIFKICLKITKLLKNRAICALIDGAPHRADLKIATQAK